MPLLDLGIQVGESFSRRTNAGSEVGDVLGNHHELRRRIHAVVLIQSEPEGSETASEEGVR